MSNAIDNPNVPDVQNAGRLKELLQAFHDHFGDAVLFDEEINGGDAVDWIAEFVPYVRAALSGPVEPTKAQVALCEECGSRQVVADTQSVWSVALQRWEMSSVMDDGHSCQD